MLADLILLIAAYVIMRALATLAGLVPASAKGFLDGVVIVVALLTTLFAGLIAVVTLSRGGG